MRLVELCKCKSELRSGNHPKYDAIGPRFFDGAPMEWRQMLEPEKEIVDQIRDSFGEKIKKLRKERRLLQQDVATAIGVQKGAITNLERGKYSPSVETVIAIADFFEVTTDWLLGRTDGKFTCLIDYAQVKEMLKVETIEVLNASQCWDESPYLVLDGSVKIGREKDLIEVENSLRVHLERLASIGGWKPLYRNRSKG